MKEVLRRFQHLPHWSTRLRAQLVDRLRRCQWGHARECLLDTASVLMKLTLVSVIVIAVLVWTRCTMAPVANPREDWVPRAWGKPWQPAYNTWEAVAKQRKLENSINLHQSQQFSSSSRQEGLRHGHSWRLRAMQGPVRLKYPVLWAAPFFSRSGYGTEAISYVVGLLENGLIAPEDLWIAQAGDGYHEEAVQGLEPAIRDLLFAQEWRNITKRLNPVDRDRPVILVCHVFPTCWRTASDDMPSKWMLIRGWLSFVSTLKAQLFGVKQDDGCPCPNEYIKDRVVYRVGRSMFETEKLPAPLVAFSKDLDELLVPSQFSVDSFAASGVPQHKLHILPQGINTTLFDVEKKHKVCIGDLGGAQVVGLSRTYRGCKHRPGLGAVYQNFTDGKSARRPNSQEPYRFLSVFKWEARKGWDILLNGYFREFTAFENVELHIVTHAFGEHVEDFRMYMREAVKKLLNVTNDGHLDLLLPRVYVYDKYIPDSIYPSLYNSMDTLVVPTHGEGWGRPQFEAMAMGKPVISTNWSGLTEFMDDTVSYPIRVESLIEIDDPTGFMWFQGQKWAQPSVLHMRQLMRAVTRHRDVAQGKGQAAARRIRSDFSVPAVAKKTLHELLRLQDTVDRLMGQNSSLPWSILSWASYNAIYP